MILGMLEYLSQLKALYPYYPQVELQGLREDSTLLFHYQVATRHVVQSGRDRNDILQLPYDTHMALLIDPDVCDSWSLLLLLSRTQNAEDERRVLRRMYSWKNFDPRLLHKVTTTLKSDRRRRWEILFLRTYNERLREEVATAEALANELQGAVEDAEVELDVALADAF